MDHTPAKQSIVSQWMDYKSQGQLWNTQLHVIAWCRLNMSHGDHKSHKAVVDLVKEYNKLNRNNVAIMLDTKGPEVRSGDVTEPIEMKPGIPTPHYSCLVIGIATCWADRVVHLQHSLSCFLLPNLPSANFFNMSPSTFRVFLQQTTLSANTICVCGQNSSMICSNIMRQFG